MRSLRKKMNLYVINATKELFDLPQQGKFNNDEILVQLIPFIMRNPEYGIELVEAIKDSFDSYKMSQTAITDTQEC